MHDLNAMRMFIHVADAGSFAGAARQLGLSTSVVSHHVAKLERALGTALLQRTTRRVGLTDAGARYLARARAIVDESNALLNEMRELGTEPSGLLRISVSPGIDESIVVPPIIKFLERYQGISLAIDVTDRVVDIVAEGYDAAIRAGELTDSSYKVRHIDDIAFTLCASPDYCSRRGVPRTPYDLADHDIAHWFSRSQRSTWIFRKRGRKYKILVSGRLTVNSATGLLDVTRSGLAVSALPDFIVEPDLETGRLVALLEDYEIEKLPLSILWPSSHLQSHKLRLLIEHLVASFESFARDA